MLRSCWKILLNLQITSMLTTIQNSKKNTYWMKRRKFRDRFKIIVYLIIKFWAKDKYRIKEMIFSATYGLKNKITCLLKNLFSFRIQLNQIPSLVLKFKFNHITAMLSVQMDSNFKLSQRKSPLTKPCK